MQQSIVNLLYGIVKTFHIPVSLHAIERAILTHPEYPSMQCISDALHSWKIKHVVMQITLEKLITLNVPVIAHLKKEAFIWVSRVTDSKIYYWNASGKEKAESLTQFEQEWTGIALAIEDIEGAGDPNFKAESSKETKEKILKSLITGGFLALIADLTYFSWSTDDSLSLLPKLFLFSIQAVGCFIIYLLIRQEKHQSDALSAKFCKIGKYVDCKKVTDSKYSTIWGFISWAELGATCFGSMLLWVAVAPLSGVWLPPLWWFSLLVLPFTLWSLATQAFVIRKWCLFCCTIVFLLWANAAVLFICYPQPAILSIPNVAMAGLLFLICLVAIIQATKTIGAKGRSFAQQRETAEIKYNIQTLQAQLSETTYTMDKLGFTWGTSISQFDIGLYVSIGCHHCGNAVAELRRIMDIFPDFNYRLIFAVHSDDFDDKSNSIVRHLICLYKAMDRNQFLNVLDRWYKTPLKNHETLQEAFPVSSVQDCQTEMDALHAFNRQSKISYTPAILLNGQLLSRLYSYNDLYGIARAFNAET